MEQIMTKPPAAKKIKRKKPEMSEKMLKDFVGHVDHLYEISVTNVFHNRYRIDIWTNEYKKEESIAPSFKIEKSFFVVLTDDDEIVDKTIQPKPRDERIF